MMTLTAEQKALIERRKSPDLTIHEFLEVTLLQVEVHLHQLEKFEYLPRIDELRTRINEVSLMTPIQQISQLNIDIEKLYKEITA